MYIKSLDDCSEFIAGDNSILREILNPRKEKSLKINYSLAWAQVLPDEKTLPHKLCISEVYFILKGTGKMHINKEEKSVKQNDTIYIPSEAIQFIENTGTDNLEFLCIVDPAWQACLEQILKKGK